MSDPDRAVLITARIRLEMNVDDPFADDVWERIEQIVREELEHDAG